MITDRLKEIELRKKSFAELLGISRPTLDKFIEAYESGQKETVNPRVRKVFDFIEDNPFVGRNKVTEFVNSLREQTDEGTQPPPEKEEDEATAIVRHFMEKNEGSPKADFFAMATKTTDFDEVIRYLLKVKPLLRERRLTEEQIALLKPYDDIHNLMENEPEE